MFMSIVPREVERLTTSTFDFHMVFPLCRLVSRHSASTKQLKLIFASKTFHFKEKPFSSSSVEPFLYCSISHSSNINKFESQSIQERWERAKGNNVATSSEWAAHSCDPTRNEQNINDSFMKEKLALWWSDTRASYSFHWTGDADFPSRGSCNRSKLINSTRLSTTQRWNVRRVKREIKAWYSFI